jgi:phage/plasmid-associated DNA primase
MISEDLYKTQHLSLLKAIELKKEEKENLIKTNRRMTSSIPNIKEIITHIITRARQTLKEFNSDPFIIGFENGLYDLMKDEFRPYTYEDYITITTKYDYKKPDYADPKIEALKKSLEGIFEAIHPNKDKLKIMYETLASALDGRLYQNLFLFNGKGGNGKGLIAALMNIILGSYYHQPNSGIIKDMDNAEKANAPSPDLANLQHKRFLLFEEIGGSTISRTMVNKLSGGGNITGRFLGQDPIVFEMSATIVLYFNQQPDFDGDMGEAELRRLINLFFEVNFTTDDAKVGTKKGKVHLLKANTLYETPLWRLSVRDIFLDILLDKYRENLKDRTDEDKQRGVLFTIPDCVKRATKEFMENQNVFIPIVEDLFNKVEYNEGDKIDDENSITLKGMFKAVSLSNSYTELTGRQKRTHNEKKFKKWIEDEFQTITPKDKGVRVLKVVKKPYEEGDYN